MCDSSGGVGGVREATKDWWPSVLSAAAQVVSESGVGGLDIYQVAERSGVSRAALYQAVGSNEGLIRELIRSTRDAMDPLIEKAALAETVPQYVELMMAACREIACEFPEFAVLYMGLTANLGGPLSAYASLQLEDAMVLVLINLIEEGKRRGTIDVDVNPGISAWMIDNMVTMYLFSLISEYHQERLAAYLGDKNLSARQIDRAVMRFVTAALSPRS